MRTLVVAAGGGGDAITGSALVRHLGLVEPAVVMTYSWDRLMVDPLPGPRTAGDFTGLRHLATDVLEVVASSRPVPPAGSSLPRLARSLPGRLLLLDPAGGTLRMAAQISAAVIYCDASDVVVLDVGGDVLTSGDDPGLRSPLADQLALAASVAADPDTRLLVTAPGIDGELSPRTVLDRLHTAGAELFGDLTEADLAPVRSVFSWHPSEASGLLAAAARGRRGRVEVRDAGDHVDLTDTTTQLYSVPAAAVLPTVPAALLHDAASLAQAEQIIATATGISEIRYETAKSERLSKRNPPAMPGQRNLEQIDMLAARAYSAGADYVSVRRLAELVDAITLPAFEALTALLARERPDQYEPSLYRAHRSSA